MDKIEKPTIIITSLGRTGTKFFTLLFRELLPHATILHDPDRINSRESILRQMKESGMMNLFVWRTLGRWRLVSVSDKRVTGALDERQALSELMRQRANFIENKPGSVYVESNSSFYGLLDLLPKAFNRHRVVYLVRDGRTWVRSQMNWNVLYADWGYLKKRLSHRWPTAEEMPEDPYYERWPFMSRFERICWAWSRLNQFALRGVENNPHTRVFRFEDIFNSEADHEPLETLIGFALTLTDWESGDLPYERAWLNRKVHESVEGFPEWRDWSREQKGQFWGICGSLMEELGYYD